MGEFVCGVCGGRMTCAHCAEGDLLRDARRTIGDVMRGRIERNAVARLRAAELVLTKKLLGEISDEDLTNELRRRAAA